MKRLALAGVFAALIIFSGFVARSARAETVTIAVATNFSDTLDTLISAFQAETGHAIVAVSGSTGQLYAQILNGAPYDLFLAADQARPSRLATTSHAVADTQFTYASGALALWSTRVGITSQTGQDLLVAGDFRRLAIANPALAPYGMAALESLQSLHLADTLQDRIVRGENIGQTFLLVATGNADLGLIARSQLVTHGDIDEDSWWPIPTTLHAPIRQDAVLLRRGTNNAAARAFLAYLASDTAQDIIIAHGYVVTPQ